ncbi:MAG: prolyl oligopeptidase family serine peptidase [Gemmataceae bacterium]
MSRARLLAVVVLLAGSPVLRAGKFEPADIFKLQWASDPQIAPDGLQVVYVRNFMDEMKDRRRSNLWVLATDGKQHRPLTTGDRNDALPRWSPDGKRLAYIAGEKDETALMVRWLDTGQTARLCKLTGGSEDIAWSPDGKHIAFSMHVEAKPKPFIDMPARPKGAEWAPAPIEIRAVAYRHDGQGYLKPGHAQIFVVSSAGGPPRQVTSGPYHHKGRLSWTPDGAYLIFSANRREDAELEPLDTEVYEVKVADGKIKQLTDRRGPDSEPTVSADGKLIAYVGYDDKRLGYHNTRLYVMNRDGSAPRALTEKLDRSVRSPVWHQTLSKQNELYFLYDDLGDTKIASVGLDGEISKPLIRGIGGTTIGRPYASGSFSTTSRPVSTYKSELQGAVLAFTATDGQRPADVGVLNRSVILDEGEHPRTNLNADLFKEKPLGKLEEINYKSAHDGREIQGWILKPPDFDPGKKYPLILEIHGGPFANYGPRFSAEMQLYAAAGHVVFYCNPRGSTGYGAEFANLIHHNYPSQDYDDLMSGVAAVVKKGYIDDKRLFVTGGSGGGVLSAWTVGKTDRFRAAVVCKPVINWYSHALTADIYPFFTKYWFPGYPWEKPDEYLKRSPIALAGNIKTPTMVICGEEDQRCPIGESEQLYQALKLRKIDTMLVRVPGAPHDISRRPSQLIAKVLYVLKWFEVHGK